MKTTGMRIVCGIDFSVHAAEAANIAAALAMRLDETVVLIHVVENSGLGALSPRVFDKLMGSIRGRLHDEAERLRKLGVTVKEQLLKGSPYQALVEAGRRPGTRLLVVSSRGGCDWVRSWKPCVGRARGSPATRRGPTRQIAHRFPWPARLKDFVTSSGVQPLMRRYDDDHSYPGDR